MHLTHILVEDFFSDPHAVRRDALALSFPPRPDKAYYPGRNSASALPLAGIETLISEIVHEPLRPARQLSHGRPRIALAWDKAKMSVHIDFCHWSAIVYLTPDEHCRGGTHFFRHRETGWERAPVFPGEPESMGFADADHAMDVILKEGATDRAKWDETMMIPMRFNRLVLFRGYMWHDAGISFGDSPETGRLILPMFFENVNG